MAFNFFKKKKKKTEKEETPEKEVPKTDIEKEAPAESTGEQTDTDTRIENQVSGKSEPAPEAPEPESVDKTEPVPDIPDSGVPESQVPETPEPEPMPSVREKPSSKGIFSKLKKGLSKTRDILTTDINEFFSENKKIDDDLLEELEELLVTSDLGVENAMKIMETLTARAKKLETADELKDLLKKELAALFPDAAEERDKAEQMPKPYVIMMVGVNGTGKTTTLGKMAMKYKSQGKSVLIGASDTFRAAAVEQLEIWANRAGASFVRHREGADPAAVAFDAVEAATARGIDVVLIDTAGRLHTQKNLMEELKKIKRSIGKRLNGAPHEVLMVLDATTGQNAISQAELFHQAVGITDLAVTKLDGSAKGGVVASVAHRMKLPVKYVGVGEGIEDLQDFDPHLFVNALLD